MHIKTYLLGALIAGSMAVTNVASAAPTADSARHPRVQLTPEQKMEKRLAHAKQKLNLTDDQVAKLKAVLQQRQAQILADREAFKNAEKGSDARKAARQKMMADNKAMVEQLKGVLNEEQLAKFKKMRMIQMEKRKEHMERKLERKERKIERKGAK